MKCGIAVSIFITMAACNYKGKSEQPADSTNHNENLPPETNYVMQNNVEDPLKKEKITNPPPGNADSTASHMDVTVDTTAIFLSDSVRF